MVRTRSNSAATTPHRKPLNTERQPAATVIAATPKTPLTSSTTIIPSSLKSVFLYDWWLVKADDGEGLAVGGFASRERAGLRVFYSAAISTRLESTVLEATDGIIITVSGFINRSRTHENGFPPKVYNHFLLGFPFNWKDYMGSSSNETSPFQCIEARSRGTSYNLESELDDLAVTRLRDIFLSTYGESSRYLSAKSPNSVSTSVENFKSALNETPKVSQSVTSYQDLKEQYFWGVGEKDAVKDTLCTSLEPDVELPISGSRGVCTRSMTKLKNSRNRIKENFTIDSQKRQKHRENGCSGENLDKGTGQKVKRSSNVTSRNDLFTRSDMEVDAITNKSESRRSSRRLMKRKQN